jgi:2-polyprenyl-3-methyl-5-hydroxy-6-metoxy-1,4-benzoquinol methylase
MLTESVFAREPDWWADGIPCFSGHDRYTENYARIAVDHLERMQPGSANPWIPDTLWLELEQSTLDLIKAYSSPGQRVLDIGVSLGRLLDRCAELDRHGMDISIDYLKIARQKGIRVAYARLEDMPYREGIFDLAVATDVLEHVLDLHLCTTRMLTAIKPGGIVIIRVPYMEDLSPYLQPGLPYEFIHLRNFDENSIRLHFEKIFRCDVLETKTVAPYYQGATRLRHRLFSQGDALRTWLETTGSRVRKEDPAGFELIRAISAVPEERLLDWISEVREKRPQLYEEVKHHLLLPIEINAVIRKPT